MNDQITIDKLIKEINEEKKDILNMSNDELTYLKEIILNNKSYISKKNLSKKIFKSVSSLYDFDYLNPFWFKKNTNFSDNIWILKINNLDDKRIDFTKITLEDNSSLTDHPKLLNSFKIWIVNQGNPLYFSGKVPSRTTISANINKVLGLIDYIILNSDELLLSSCELSCIDENFFQDLFIQLASMPANEAIYNYKITVSEYLKDKIKDISLEQVHIFEHRFPLIPLNIEEGLDLTFEEKRKARLYLYQQKAYYRGEDLIPKPNTRFFNFLFTNTIAAEHRIFESLDDLALYMPFDFQEYNAIPTRTQFEEEGQCDQNIEIYIKQFHILASVNDYSFCSRFEKNNLSKITPERIRKRVQMKPVGRHATLPGNVVFPCVKNAFEFIFSYLEPLLETMYRCYVYVPPRSEKNKKSFDYSYLKKSYWKDVTSPELKQLGVKSFRISDKDPQKFIKRRNNEGLCDLYNVLIGALLIVIGTISARRQHEIIDLKANKNLSPPNLEPNLYPNLNFELKFKNRKSGTYFLEDSREELSRPILNSVAQIIYKLEKFNERILNTENLSENISLINTYNHYGNRFKALDNTNYSKCLNAFCDYFETPVIEYKKDDFRRFYLRQHQLRRFFAMLFFWSKSFDGLDSIRYFLGHTDTEHLYHYITESITGEVLNGIKATSLVDNLISKSQDKIENIAQLTQILEKKFNVRELEILAEDSISDLYPKESLDFIQKKELINQVYLLLEANDIELKPTFFSTKNCKGEIIRDYKLVLIIKDEL
ncbi:hypothetical protein [Acinetobacter sp. NIOH-H-8]|uniref:hypothetical protein n=1 Tax=Acinetobacter sp. NIOH-H-8 TaxID=3342120 RepID=UPI003986DE80